MQYISKALRVASVNERSQFYLPPTRLSTNGMCHYGFIPQPQRITALWLVLVFRSIDGRRLSWLRWLVRHRCGRPMSVQRRSLVLVRRPGIDLTTANPAP